MSAYAAVISLKRTINALLDSSRVTSSREILEFAFSEATSLQQVLEIRSNDGSRSRSRSRMEKVDALEGQIRDCAYKLEDFLEFHELKLEEEDEYEDEEGVTKEEISSFAETAKRLEKEYIQELSREDNDDDNDDDDDDDEDAAKTGVSDTDELEMIGRSRLFDTIRSRLVSRMRPDDRCIWAFSGEQGSGATLVVKTVFEDAREAQQFECLAWARVGAHHDLKQVVMTIISQVVVHFDMNLVDDDEPGKYLYKALENRRYLIVLDDVDDVKLVKYLRRTSFPDQGNGSAVLLITSLKKEAVSTDLYYNFAFPNIYEDDIWFRMRQALFGRQPIPAELEVAGKKIVHNCRRRFISVAKALVFLSKSDKTMEQWSKIAADQENSVFMIVDEVSEINEIKKELQCCKREIAELASKWVDFSYDAERVKMGMYPERFFSKMQILSFFGMAGIGKTTFVKKVFKDRRTLRRFDHHVWIRIGPRYQAVEILIDILSQIFPSIPKLDMKGEERLIKELCAQVSSKSCLIVLDDLCSKEPLLHLRYMFSDIRGTIMVTTRLAKVARFGRDDAEIEMQLLDEEESWCLLRQKVFGGGMAPPELEKAGRKIAEKCDGLPLLIITVADELLQVEQSEEYWDNVASGKEKSVFKNAHNQISEALLPSYQCLPQHLKPCFLYMGVFREKYEIPSSNLSNMWISDGFLKPNSSRIEEDFYVECLSELADRSLVMVQRKVSDLPITTCRLHSVFWHLSNSQAMKNKFFHAMNSYDDCSVESMEGHRRLCIRNSILLSMKDVHKSIASNTSVRSLLCVGPLHQYAVPLNFDLKLLRVINVVTIRLYEFPIQVVSLFHLRYLSLTCNGKLPASISKLRKLQYLIVKRYIDIISSKDSSDLPAEIWDMEELKHLQIMGGLLPNHRHGSGLLKLSTLLDVSAQSCGEEVLKWIPNLKRLGVRIELTPTDEGNPFYYLNNIHYLHKLESLKCVVVNPHTRFEAVSPPPPTMFPQSLRKLSLSGTGYPWNHMSMIGKLENLEVLKLRCYAFQGPKWEMDYTNQFEKLKYLLLEDTYLVNWKLSWGADMKVEHLCIKHCYKLQELPLALCALDNLKKIEIVECSPVLMTWAEQMKKVIPNCEVNIHCSW